MPADVLAVLADPTRRRLVEVLCDGERSVGDLVAAVDIAQPGVSRHVLVRALCRSAWPGLGRLRTRHRRVVMVVEFEIDTTVHRPSPREERFIAARACHTIRKLGRGQSRWLYGYRR